MNKKANLFFTVVLIVATVLFIFSSSLLLPLISRSFYFGWAKNLNILNDLNKESFYIIGRDSTFQDIKDAYNSVMDFIWKGRNFPVNPNKSGSFLTGSLPLSIEGKEHFKDVKVLFWFVLIVFAVSGAELLGILVLRIKKFYQPNKIFNMSPLFLSAIIALGIIIILALFIIPDFHQAYVVFHEIIFPGKDNYYFNMNEDAFVLLLPERYILACAITAAVMLTIESGAAITYSLITRKKEALEVK